MLVYVLNKNGKPLMPCSPRKARLLLKTKAAKVVKRCPFTIQLKHGSSGYKQHITLGVDSGSKTIGLSASTTKKELFSGTCFLRNDIVNLLSDRKRLRAGRRFHKTRYRQPRFLNRVSSKKKGWIAPSIQNKIQTHLKVIENLHKILPITKIIAEVASFDIQKIKNPDISSSEYQKGEQLNFANVREYVLFRDGHICQHCRGKSKDKVLCVHHLESRKTGGNAPNNLLTLCKNCHADYHSGEIELPTKRGKSFRDAAFMGIMRWEFFKQLQAKYSNTTLTYGYITKNTRITHNLPKEHQFDAYCIAGNISAMRMNVLCRMRKMRSHDRMIHKMNYAKGHVKIRTRQGYIIHGFRKYDFVEAKGKFGFITNRRLKGSFGVSDLEGKLLIGTSPKHIKIIETTHNILSEIVGKFKSM